MDCSPLTIASATRAFPGEVVNGDAWVIHRSGGVFRLSVIDGLGHGPEAAAAAQAALNCLDGIVDAEPEVAIQACHQALRRTRGAVMLVISIDIAANRLRIAGVGNVEARLQLADREHRLVSYRGIVGVVLPRIRTFDMTCRPSGNSSLIRMGSERVSIWLPKPMERRSAPNGRSASLSAGPGQPTMPRLLL